MPLHESPEESVLELELESQLSLAALATSLAVAAAAMAVEEPGSLPGSEGELPEELDVSEGAGAGAPTTGGPWSTFQGQVAR